MSAVLADFERKKTRNKMTREEWVEEHVKMYKDADTPISTKAALLDKIGKAQGFIKETVPESDEEAKSANLKVRKLSDRELKERAEQLGIRIDIHALGNNRDNGTT